jgi:hypothetical protein
MVKWAVLAVLKLCRTSPAPFFATQLLPDAAMPMRFCVVACLFSNAPKVSVPHSVLVYSLSRLTALDRCSRLHYIFHLLVLGVVASNVWRQG